LSRLPWENRRNYPVYVGTHYRQEWANATTNGMADHPSYHAAKHEGDVNAALRVVKDSLSRLYIVQMRMMLQQMEQKGFEKPVLVAPYRADSKNMLARTAAVYLGEQLGLEVDDKIVEMPGKSRRLMDKFERIFNTPDYAGEVQKGRAYIAVDDMITTGGTLSSLRSYIDEQGGRFLFSCSMASVDGKNTTLNPQPSQIEELSNKLSKHMQKWLENVADVKLPTLTRAETAFLLSGKNAHGLRDIACAANGIGSPA
jgi:orotate phosphoribosyltransferase-like protein